MADDVEIQSVGGVHAGAGALARLAGPTSVASQPPTPNWGADEFGTTMQAGYPADWVGEINDAKRDLGAAIADTGHGAVAAVDELVAEDHVEAEEFGNLSPTDM